jgi:cellulose synthase/poly-beta-1,6-N-acetylglucosamine synthase-like glycosyltransferase
LGKPNAMNATVPMTSGEIVVISDADSAYAPDALRKLVRNFADPQVGAVTGEERRVAAADGTGMGEGLYCRLDNLIKRLEGRIGSMVMVNGGFVAIRRELYPFLDPHFNFDLVWAPWLRLQGYRTAYEPEAVSVETYPLDSGGDFRRRIRTVLQAFYSYLSVPAALNPFRVGWYAVELFSHRFSRWFVLPCLLVALAANAVLESQGLFYRGLLIAQLACYACALIGWLLDRAGKRPLPFYTPYYFVYIHLAAFVAVLQAVFGRRVASWAPTERSQETQGVEV